MAPIALPHGDGAPGDGAEDYITSARRFWRVELGSLPRRRPTRRRVFPAPLFCADGGGLSIGWISCWTSSGCGVESVLREGCPRTTTGVSQCWLSGHFRQVFFNTIALPRIYIDDNVWGEARGLRVVDLSVQFLATLNTHCISRSTSRGVCVCVCVYYCRTYYKAVCGGGGGQ